MHAKILGKIRKIRKKQEKLGKVYAKYGLPGVYKLVVNFPMKRIGLDLYPRRPRSLSGAGSLENALRPFLFINQELKLHDETPLDRPLQVNRGRSKGVLNWIIPDFGFGSGGGHINIFRFIQYLESQGISNNIYIFSNERFSFDANRTVLHFRRDMKKFFGKIKGNVFRWSDYCVDSDAVVATCWETAYPAYSVKNTRNWLYFVQDFEPSFFPQSSDSVFAENTYRMGFTGITAGDWLAKKLHGEYGMQCYPYGFATDEMYKATSVSHEKKNRLFFYARPPTVRRGFELGLLSLNLFHEMHPEVEIVLAGWDIDDLKVPFPYTNAKIIKYHKLPAFYQSCDVALVLSLTNGSLLPPDLMASGCLTVTNSGYNNEWLVKHGENGLVAEPDPISIAKTLSQAFTDDDLRNRITKQAHAYATNLTWEQEYSRVYNPISDMIK